MSDDQETTLGRRVESALKPAYYRFRWRFEYHSNKASVHGVWNDNHNGKDIRHCAWAVDKKDLAQCIIQSENIETFQVENILAVSGKDYASMEWVCQTKVPGGFNSMSATQLDKLVLGVSVLTHTERITCWYRGFITRAALTEHDRKFLLREHSEGGKNV